MKNGGIIHPELARVLAELGHGQQIVVADAGLPIPAGVARIDLGYRLGAPLFLDVLGALASDIVVEELTMADEAATHCADLMHATFDLFPDARRRSVSHEQFKVETSAVRAVIRTGEITPYANVQLRSGVPF